MKYVSQIKATVLVYTMVLVVLGVFMATVVLNIAMQLSSEYETRNIELSLRNIIQGKADLAIKYARYLNTDGSGFVDNIGCPIGLSMSGTIQKSENILFEYISSGSLIWCRGMHAGIPVDIYFNSGYTDTQYLQYAGSQLDFSSSQQNGTLSDSDITFVNGNLSFPLLPDLVDDDFNSDDYHDSFKKTYTLPYKANVPATSRSSDGSFSSLGPSTSVLSSTTSWSADNNALNRYLQLNLGSSVIAGIITKGRGNFNQWVTSFTLQYSLDGTSWTPISQTFTGNIDRDTEVQNLLPTPVEARYLRIYPVTYTGHKSLRADALISETIIGGGFLPQYTDNDALARKHIFGYVIEDSGLYNIFWSNSNMKNYISENPANLHPSAIAIGSSTGSHLYLDIDTSFKMILFRLDKNAYDTSKELLITERVTGTGEVASIGYLQTDLSLSPVKTGTGEYLFDFVNHDYALFIENTSSGALLYQLRAEHASSGTGLYINPLKDQDVSLISYFGSHMFIDDEGKLIADQYEVSALK